MGVSVHSVMTVLLGLAVLGLVAIVYQLIKQQGRILLRVDELERRLAEGAAPDSLQSEPEGLVPGTPVAPFSLPDLSGRQVDLKSITAPVLNVFALDDHIIPPDCSRALGAKVGSTDYTEIPLPGGHVGLFVSSKSQGKLSQSIADWLVARDANPVSEA